MTTRLHTLTIDGHKYQFIDGDVPPQLHTETIIGSFEGNVLDSNLPPSPDISQQEWALYLSALKVELDKVEAVTKHIDTSYFSDRTVEAVRSRLHGSSDRLEVKAQSTFSYGNDMPHEFRPELAQGYAQAYGVDPADLETLPYVKSSLTPCPLFSETSQSDSTHLFERRTFISDKSDDYIVRYCGTQYESATEPVILGIFKSFVTHYQTQIDKALAVLSKNHPDIAPENLRLFYYQLMYLEFNLFEPLDIMQDAAASVYSGASQMAQSKDAFLEALGGTDDLGARIAFSDAGDDVWLQYSAMQGVPIATQGLGPLQIIPGLAQAAYEEPHLYEGYSTLLSRDDFYDITTLIKAEFDPEKMFALKAMTWDLQLRQMEKLDYYTTKIETTPHIRNPKTARELALLVMAEHLVQYPERMQQEPNDFLGTDTLVFIMMPDEIARTYMMGDVFGVTPKLDGITTQKMNWMPNSAFAYYGKKGAGEITCLFSQ